MQKNALDSDSTNLLRELDAVLGEIREGPQGAHGDLVLLIVRFLAVVVARRSKWQDDLRTVRTCSLTIVILVEDEEGSRAG